MDRPTRTSRKRQDMPDADRAFDTTELDLETSGGYIVHRDYAAHYFKYGFIRRFAHKKRVLEIGCGTKMPTARTVQYGTSACVPDLFVGLDYGRISKPVGNKWARHHAGIDATSVEARKFIAEEYGEFDVVVSLEVIEHMTVESGRLLLETIWHALSDDGIAIISTPIFDGAQAINHIHEYTAPELQHEIETAGFVVEKRFGTFMSVPDLTKAVKSRYGTDAGPVLELIEQCSGFYHNDVLANWFAPAFPDEARNNVWVIRKDVESLL